MISKITIETDLVSLNEVLNATGNPTVATLILNGTYQEPEFYKADRASSPDKDGNRNQYIFVSYNKWKDEVHYTYKGSWARDMSREAWENLDFWEDVMNSQVDETVDA